MSEIQRPTILPSQTVEDYIDKPIRKCVALLNLLGLKTQFSCCGYNYKDQEPFRAHNLGRPYVFIKADEKSFDLIKRIQSYKFTSTRSWMLMLCAHPWGDHYWHMFCIMPEVTEIANWKNSMHEYEYYISPIKNLEDCLISMSDLMQDTATIKDFNDEFRKWSSLWEVPAAPDWIVKKADYIKGGG